MRRASLTSRPRPGRYAPLTFTLPPEVLDALAEEVTERVLERFDSADRGTSPYLTVTEAAAHLRAKPQRVYDLLSARRLTRHKDGRRVLVARAELDDYLAASRPNRIVPALSPAARDGLRKGLSG
jgi:excisionase family DNA binding protein